MKVHIFQVPHTLPTRAYSHCAFTQKARLLPEMLAAQGLTTVAYGTGDGAECHPAEWVSIMDEAEWRAIVPVRDPMHPIGMQGEVTDPIYRQFNVYLRDALADRLDPGDVIALPFSSAHAEAYERHPLIQSGEVALIESGIGYPDAFAHFRVYESEAWRHFMLAKEGREGADWSSPRREWVVPNYYDARDWPTVTARPWSPDPTVVYLGRLERVKGLDLIPILAERHPDVTFVLCGQGDPTPFCTAPNIEYEPPIAGRARAVFLGDAMAAICPSRFVEPFCGSAVEAMLCGTPVITSDFGAFTETVVDGVTGVRCRGLATWDRALETVADLPRSIVGTIAHSRYTLPVVGRLYARVFEELAERMAVLAEAR